MSREAETVADLISKGANVNTVDEEGNTPLHLAVEYNWRNMDVLETLIQNGANLKAVNLEGKTPEGITDEDLNQERNSNLKKAIKSSAPRPEKRLRGDSQDESQQSPSQDQGKGSQSGFDFRR